MTSRSALVLTTLGSASLVRATETGSSTCLGPGKPLALSAYLAAAPARSASRERLMELLWSDRSLDAAQHALRQTLWYLRQRVGPGFVVARGDTLALETDVSCDRNAFLDAIQSGDLERGVAWYGGDFLPGGAGPGSSGFEDWAGLERYRLRQLFRRSGESLVRVRLQAGRFQDALALARRIRDANTEHEGCWRLLLETLLLAGERTVATSEADVLEWQLAVRGCEPEPETRELVRDIRRAATAPAAPPRSGVPEPRLVGRDEQLAAILCAWDRAARDGGAHLGIMAAAGFGKTRLLAEARARLEAVGVTVVSLAANAATRKVPHLFASEMATALAALPGSAGVSQATAASLVALNPALSSRYPVAEDRSVANEAIRRRLLALAELLQATSEERPLALLLDDVHWADAASQQILGGVLARLERIRVLAVTAARPTAVTRTTPSSETLHLPPLEVTHVRTLLADLGALPAGGWGPELPRQLHAVASGSPLVLLDVLDGAFAKGVLALTAAGWGCPNPDGLAAELQALAAASRSPGKRRP